MVYCTKFARSVCENEDCGYSEHTQHEIVHVKLLHVRHMRILNQKAFLFLGYFQRSFRFNRVE